MDLKLPEEGYLLQLTAIRGIAIVAAMIHHFVPSVFRILSPISSSLATLA
jgi:hypothetical protein